MPASMAKILELILLIGAFSAPRQALGFLLAPASTGAPKQLSGRGSEILRRRATVSDTGSSDEGSSASRRELFRSALGLSASALLTAGSFVPAPVMAAERQPLDSVLYRILRVKEAVQQETRLIKSGKFKDVQRANVKLAVKFMINNYRLNDAFVTASAYLDSNDRRIEAGQVGQSAVQNLYTILEYFDSSDIQNIKVGQDGLGGKEQLVLKGLDATRKQIDDFLSYFPKSDIDAVVARIAEENRLNVNEFDPTLGDIVNLAPPS